MADYLRQGGYVRDVHKTPGGKPVLYAAIPSESHVTDTSREKC